MSAYHPTDSGSFLQEIRELYEEGDKDNAFELLDSMLVEAPDDAEVRLLKAELCLRAEREAGFVGQAAHDYWLRGEHSDREQAVIDGAMVWAERELDKARKELTGRYADVDDALRYLDRAVELVPWDASTSLAKGMILLDFLGRQGEERGGERE